MIELNDFASVDNEILFQNIEQGKKYKVVFFVRSTGAIDMTVSFKNAETGGILASNHIQ